MLSVRKTACTWLVSPDKLAPVKWMGCWVAVYDLVVQEKLSGRVERSRPKRGTKRRGGAAGRKGGRKRRRLVASDPGLSSHTEPPSVRFEVLMYREERKALYLNRLSQLYVHRLKSLQHSREPRYVAAAMRSMRGVEKHVRTLMGKEFLGIWTTEARSSIGLDRSTCTIQDLGDFLQSVRLIVGNLREGHGYDLAVLYSEIGTIAQRPPSRGSSMFSGYDLNAEREQDRAVFDQHRLRMVGESSQRRRQPRGRETRQNVARAPLCRHCGMSPCLDPTNAPFCRPRARANGKRKAKR